MLVILIILIVRFGKSIEMNDLKKVVVLGSLGMAGHIIAEYLYSTGHYEVYGIARQKGRFVNAVMDVTNFEVLKEHLKTIAPDYVVNCIGVLVSQSKNNISNAILLNSYLPHFLSEIGRKINYKLIHISTDCVFSGKQGQYKEDSFRDGDDNYARTKALGEVDNETDLTIRTSIIGPELKDSGTGLIDWFFKQHGSINGYSKAYWSGVTTLELAKATDETIKQNITGVYHLCPTEKVSKYNLLKTLAKIWNKDIEVKVFEDYNVDKSLVCTRCDFVYPAPDYGKMLGELKEWMDKHTEYYSYGQ